MVDRIAMKKAKPNGKKPNGNGADGTGTSVVVPPPGAYSKISKFKPDYVRMAKEVCRLGATNPELAKVLDVNVDTINEWRIRYPEFEEATRVGKAEADERVTSALFHRAVGYYIQTEKLFLIDTETTTIDDDGNEVVTKTKTVKHEPVTEYVHPDTTACIFWLKNRRPDQWREKATFEHTGSAEGPVTVQNARQVLFDRVFSVAARLREVKIITQQKPE